MEVSLEKSIVHWRFLFRNMTICVWEAGYKVNGFKKIFMRIRV